MEGPCRVAGRRKRGVKTKAWAAACAQPKGENMTPLQKNILAACKHRPQTLRELQNALQVDNSRLRNTVTGMVATGMLSARNGTYVPGFAVMENTDAPAGIPCTLVKLAARFGFASRDDGTGDIFIPGRALHGAMPQDKIIIKLFDHPRVEGSAEGEVVEVTTPHNTFAGTIVLTEDGRLAVEPDGCRDVRIVLDKKGVNGAQLGDKVGAILTNRGQRHMDHRCAVAERFGTSDRAAECAKAVLYGRDVRQEFPEEVLAEAHAYDNALIDPAEAAHRADLRGLPIFTIDSAETKDIDDAISLMKTQNGGYELGVHIADVSHYVRPDTALDKEAYERATSIYYADKVIPMLPTQLSNGICSLNEGEERLAFSCLMRLDQDGNLTDYKFVKSIICSRVKGVYSEINALLAGTADAETQAKYAEVLDQLPAMKELYAHRARLRKERGCIDFESGEVKLILDENGHCIDVKKRTSGESEAMIEEFMLLANQCAAHFARVKQIPFVYRVHEEPNGEKLERLHSLLQACGINDHFAKEVPTPKELSAILEGVRGTPFEQIVNTGMLRCMSKACYEEKPKGHYGLVLKDYAHFTSPIRRYPDLAIHRMMTDLLSGTDKETMIVRYTDFAEKASKQSSEREVLAVQIERKAEDYYKAEYARRHLGECYEGIISGVSQRGIFVELENGVEGFVPASSLTATGTTLTEGIRLSDPASGKTWSLGDSMMITIVRADINLGKVDFEVAPETK